MSGSVLCAVTAFRPLAVVWFRAALATQVLPRLPCVLPAPLHVHGQQQRLDVPADVDRTSANQLSGVL